VLHPAILDAAIHSSIHHLMTGHRDTQVYYLPAKTRSLTIHDALLDGIPEKVVSHIVRKSWTPSTWLASSAQEAISHLLP
jgi:hypothetical protein